MKLAISPQDSRWVFLSETPSGIINHFNKIPSYQLLPNYHGIPRPEIFMYHHSKNISFCSAGLWNEVYDWCTKNGIECEKPKKETLYTSFNLSLEEFTDLVKNWNLNINPRPYQIEAAWKILKYKRSMSLLCTRSGKTLIGYMVFRAAIEFLGVKKILMIVPSIQLVRQGLEDFKEYKEFFNGEEVWMKGEAVVDANLTIGTYQSIVLRTDKKSKRYNPKFFDEYDLVLVDECHKLKAKSIQTILEQPFMKNIKLQFGFTGTLPKENTIDWLSCQAFMGPKIQDITTMDLVDEGFLVKPNIEQIRIHYQKYDRVLVDCGEYLISNYELCNGKRVLRNQKDKKMTMIHKKILPAMVDNVKRIVSGREYKNYLLSLLKSSSKILNVEQMVTQRSIPHIKVIDSILDKNKKNFIVFAHNTEYISYLVKHLKETFPDRNVYKITGIDNLKTRQAILDNMLKSDNNILVGSFGCVSTGLTFRRVSGMIMAQSFKSHLINIQSIGRLLLPENQKEEAKVYDIIDVYDTKRIYRQGLAKIRDYEDAKYEYKITNISTDFEDIFG